jgi:O-antigen/teichoic acid export membrane protein
MSKGRVIARNSFFLVLAHGASKIFSIALTAVAGRVLGTGGYGLYAMGLSLVEVGRVAAASGLDFLVAREVASEPTSASRVASNAGMVKIIGGLIAYFGLIVAVVLLDYPRPVLWVVMILGSALFFENLSDMVDAVFQGRERMEFTTRAFAISSAVIFVVGTIALLSGLGLVGYCAAMVVGFVLRWLIVLFLARREGFLRLSPRLVEGAEVRRLTKAAVPLLGATVIGLLFHRVDILMLGKLVEPSEVGLYGAAVRIIDVVVLAPRILGSAVYPTLRRVLTREGDRPAIDLVAESTRLSLIICSGIALCVWALAPLALRLIPGPEFVPATGALRLLAWGVALQAGVHMMARLFFAIDREKDFLPVLGLSLVCNVILNAWWIPRLGIEGAAWATVVSYSVNLGLYFLFAARRGFAVSLRRSVLGPAFALVLAGVVGVWRAPDSDLARVAWMFGAWLLALVAFRVLGRDDLRRAHLLFRPESSDD